MTASITDFTQFAELRYGAENSDPAVLREVAGQFEALFLQTMLKTMRDASIGDPLFGESEGHEMYQGMLDQQLAVEMSSGKGMGLAEMLVRQLGGLDQATSSGAANFAPPRVSDNTASDSSVRWNDPESFARDVWPHAKRVARQLNVAPEAVMAQAALETGWGKHVMSGNGGVDNSNNLFGIKASGDWDGSTVTRQTIEFEDGIARQEVAKFRAYENMTEMFDDYFQFLSTNPRYDAVQNQGDDIAGFANALAASGYATDPDYAEKISRVASSETMHRVLAPLKNDPVPPINN